MQENGRGTEEVAGLFRRLNRFGRLLFLSLVNRRSYYVINKLFGPRYGLLILFLPMAEDTFVKNKL